MELPVCLSTGPPKGGQAGAWPGLGMFISGIIIMGTGAFTRFYNGIIPNKKAETLMSVSASLCLFSMILISKEAFSRFL